FTNGTWKITAGGNGIDINADQLNFAAREVSGDTQISARIASLDGSASGQGGLMLRQSSDPGSPFFGVFIRKDHQLSMFYRENLNGPISSLGISHLTAPLPAYLQIRRVDDQFLAATSTDGVHYTGVPGSTIILTLATKVLGGLATHAGND